MPQGRVRSGGHRLWTLVLGGLGVLVLAWVWIPGPLSRSNPSDEEPLATAEEQETPAGGGMTRFHRVLEDEETSRDDADGAVTPMSSELRDESRPSRWSSLRMEEGSPRGGRFGGKERARRRHGGEGTREAMSRGLEWLAVHQSADGRWDGDGFSSLCPEGKACRGAGDGLHDVGLTGLALLAFLGDGHTPIRDTPHRQTVIRALDFILGEMRDDLDDGLIGSRAAEAFLYDHGFAAQALCEAYLLCRAEFLREPAQRAVDYISRARNPAGGWHYYVPPDGESDTILTGLMFMVLKTADDAALEFDRKAYEGALAWFAGATDPESGRCGYRTRGGPPSRAISRPYAYPESASEAPTAVALMCRLFQGESPKEHPALLAHANRLSRTRPRWSEDGSTHDLYYWFWGSYAMFQVGGRRWKAWNEAVKSSLLKSQCREGHEAGSWPPDGPWGEEGGRIYSTAMGVLTLQVYYRYACVSPSWG